MADTHRIQKQYDHRLRRLIQTTGDLVLAIRHGVPRSTARGWLTQARTNVVSIDVLDMDAEALQREVLFLQRRIAQLLALLHLVVVAIKVAEFSFDRVRTPDGARKQRLLRAIERTRSHLPLRGVLKLIGMSSARYHAWLGKQECGLDDLSCCPKSSPQQLTREEYLVIRDMVTADEYRARSKYSADLKIPWFREFVDGRGIVRIESRIDASMLAQSPNLARQRE